MRRSRSAEAPADCPLLSAPGCVRGAVQPASRPGSTARFPRSETGRAGLIVVGLAPGLRGANRTGRAVHRATMPVTFSTKHCWISASRAGSYAARSRRHAGAGRLPDHQLGALRAAGEQADACRNRHLPTVTWQAASPASQAVPPRSWHSGRIAHDSTLACAWAPARRPPISGTARGTTLRQGRRSCSIASIARATTPTPAA